RAPRPACTPDPRRRGHRMRRRDMLAALALLAVVPNRVTAQQACCRLIGLLAPNPKVFETIELERDLRALGWESGRDYRILFRTSGGSNEALPKLGAELVSQKVDVIFAAGDQAVIAAQQATTSIPIVGV